MAPPTTTYNLFFTGKDDPRNWVIIGDDVKPVIFCFETQEPRAGVVSSVRTLVYRNEREHVASFDWTPGNHLGRATIGTRQLPMSHLVTTTPTSNARGFISADGHRYEWRPCRDAQSSYDLYAPGNRRIGIFSRYAQATPVGPAHGMLQYTFVQDMLLLESILALSVNRWIDLHGY
ncbi:hypothetical protein HGRIS_013210 [Hohenbuehelia grisea]|uniref:DUF6593 domain-containing protein n=1 Tax=Hohenbuehelia grisea TaxID=104357 RepID=A0ABR3IUY5_9AGAR